MTYIDLHCHSTASDGTFAPADVVGLAQKRGLSAMSLTDHDTIGGIAEASAAASAAGIDFIPGIEISAEFPHPGTMHILGYGVDPNSDSLRNLTRQLLEGRDNRNPRIIKKLQEHNVAITMEEVEQEASKGKTAEPGAEAKPLVVGRPHIAAILMRKGYVSSIKQAFDKYLAPGGLAYFDKERLTPRQALEMIRESGGLPVLAHPVQLRTENDAQLDRIVKDLLDLGLAGLEVIHSDHDAALVEKYSALADRYKLLKTGGSDFHGMNKKDIDLGTANGRRIPREFFDRLIERVGRMSKV
ncbi:MAG TPA: PHP domain-containing protein [Humisphaera sp.]|jgi:hypothetical protein|nr:PHP domain-containing protein [Humisphaera sp.]